MTPQAENQQNTSNFHIRSYRPGDELEINAAFNDIFGKERSLETWRWKFGINASRARIQLVVDEKGAVLCHYGCQLARFLIQGIECPAGHFVDSFSRQLPSIVQAGWFGRLATSTIDELIPSGDFALLYGFPGIRAHRLSTLLGLHLNQTHLIEWSAPATLPPLGAPRPVPCIDPAGIDDVWRSASQRHQMAQLKDGDWFQWRFQARARQEAPYHFLTARSGWNRKLDAWAVLRRESDFVRWVDLEWNGRDPASLAHLKHAADRCARDWGLHVHRLWLNGDPSLSQHLLSCDWHRREVQDGPVFSYYPGTPYGKADFNHLTCRLTGGDTDLF